jgi:hypothetical protein
MPVQLAGGPGLLDRDRPGWPMGTFDGPLTYCVLEIMQLSKPRVRIIIFNCYKPQCIN